MKIKAIALISGGLDSVLAAKLIKDQGIEVIGYSFTSCFFRRDIEKKHLKKLKDLARQLKIKLKIADISQDFIKLIKSPRYGFGSNLNPCIDCKILMLKKTRALLRKEGCSFVVTGEVLGQRPMSQGKNNLILIPKRANLEGLVVRPLSAKNLEETIPEQKGWLKRERLLALNGRGRTEQIALAKKFGIVGYGWPAGGCLLADPGFSARLRELIKCSKNFSVDDVELLKYGRHFIINNLSKLIVGRDKQENEEILSLSGIEDVIFSPRGGIKGPDALLRSKKITQKSINDCLKILAFYFQKCNQGKIPILVKYNKAKKKIDLNLIKTDEKFVESRRINKK